MACKPQEPLAPQPSPHQCQAPAHLRHDARPLRPLHRGLVAGVQHLPGDPKAQLILAGRVASPPVHLGGGGGEEGVRKEGAVRSVKGV